MTDRLKILLIEDDEDDYILAQDILDDLPGRSVDLEWLTEYQPAFARLADGDVDICFVDYRIGGTTGLDFIRQARAQGHHTPLILLTGVGQRDIDIAASEAGASDYIDKSELTPLLVERTIRYAMAHAQAMRDLAEKTSLISATLECADAGIAAYDHAGNNIAMNRRFEDILDRLGRGDATETARRDVSRLLLDQLDESPAPEIEIATADGAIYEVSRSPMPLGGHVLVAIDMTDQHAAREAMLSAKRDAEAANRAKSSLFANISHELRTPLHAIIGFSDMLMQSPQDCDIPEFATFINDGGKQLLKIVNAVILFSRIEAGQHRFCEDRIVDLDHFVRDAIKPLDGEIAAKDLRMAVEIASDLQSLRFDPQALGTILLNLVTNAVDFSPSGDEVAIRFETDSDGSLMLRISDNGPGIPEEIREKVFDAFFQADHELDRSHEGVGLGLPLVKMLVEQHDCSIALHGGKQKGTEAVVKFTPERVWLREISESASA